MKLDNPVVCLSVNLETRVGHQAISCGICGGRGNGTGFSPYLICFLQYPMHFNSFLRRCVIFVIDFAMK